MGRRDVSLNNIRDDYRKSIARNDYAKVKQELKKEKRAAQAKRSGAHLKDFILVVATLSGVIFGIYILFYALSW